MAKIWPVVVLGMALALTGCEKKEGLRITGIDPKNGPYTGGTLVTVHGSGFQEGGVKGLKVYFGEKEATRVYIDGDDKIKVEPPPGEINQTVDLMFLFDDARKLEYPKAYTYEDFSQGPPGMAVTPPGTPPDPPAKVPTPEPAPPAAADPAAPAAADPAAPAAADPAAPAKPE